jgi:hypothetical protein
MRIYNPLPSLEQLVKVLKADPTSPSGLRWKVSTAKQIKPGDVAGSLRKDGYWTVRLNGKPYQANRIVWAMANEADPGNLHVDHIDGNPSNNHPDNLRLATNVQNLRNRAGRNSNNTSGIPGVSWHEGVQKWRARIGIQGKHLSLGLFACKQEAAKARRAAELKYFGEFAPITKQ